MRLVTFLVVSLVLLNVYDTGIYIVDSLKLRLGDSDAFRCGSLLSFKAMQSGYTERKSEHEKIGLL